MAGLEALPPPVRESVATFAARVAGSPAERVAIVTHSGALIEARNVSPTPAIAFEIDAAEWCQIGDRAAVVVHSHVADQAESWCPSVLDQRAQIAQQKPWAIICPDGEVFTLGVADPRPLEGRGFRFGVDDCFGLFRDAWRAWSGEDLANFPRRWRWWSDAEPLIESNLIGSGFHAIPTAEIQRGDGLLFKLRSDVFNHIGFVDSPGKMLHHPGSAKSYDPAHLSRLESLERWLAIPHQAIRSEARL